MTSAPQAPAISYAAGSTDVPLIEETIGAALRRTAAAHGDREALVDLVRDRRWTWAEVIRGGENVYPREVEEFLHFHPGIADVQVVGVPDPRYGEELCAWVRLKPGASLTEQELRAFCTGRLAHYKVPRYLVLTDEFPMTVTGKIQKFKMRDATIERLGLQPGLPTA